MTSLTEPELKPCPSCGSRDVSLYTDLAGYVVVCNECHLGLRNGLKTKEKAAAVWNRRDPPKMSRQELLAMKKDRLLTWLAVEKRFLKEIEHKSGITVELSRDYTQAHIEQLEQDIKDIEEEEKQYGASDT